MLAEINSHSQEKRELDQQISELRSHMKVLGIQSSARARIEFKRSDRDAKQSAYDKRAEHRTSEFLRILGKVVPPERAKPELTAWLDRKRKDLRAANEKLQKAKMGAFAVQGQIKMLKSEIDRDERLLKGLVTKLIDFGA